MAPGALPEVAPPGAQPKVELPSVVQPPTVAFAAGGEPTPPALAGLACPNCGSGAPKSLVLTVDVQLPDNPGKRLRLLHCPACTARFYDDQVPPDYAEPALNDRGRVPFYVQQGAGVSLITLPLAQLRRGAGTRYMEVGCGYGFSLDFALNTKGWSGIGIDPAPLAALGRDALGLPIELRYLRDDDEARGTMDVVMGSEVIEHVTSPQAFVRTLRAMLAPAGALVLTTPNGDDVDPSTPPGVLVPLLSPSLHLVIQNRRSLQTLLQQAGFGHVEVAIDSHSLVAYASDAPLALERDRATLRQSLREHLERRARALDRMGDPFLGFAARAFTESVNDGDMAAADRAWGLLVPACRARYGLDLDTMAGLPPGVESCGLEEMARLMPLNLGSLLYSQAIRRLAAGVDRAGLGARFTLAGQAAAAMRRALWELAMEDGQMEDVGWTAQAEAALCAMEAGAPDAAAQLARLPPAPNGGAARRQGFALRAMTGLVNAGRYGEARALVGELGLDRLPYAAAHAPLTELERDALFCLAILDTEIGPDGTAAGNPVIAGSRLRRVRAACPAGSGLWWACLGAEVQALMLLDDKKGMADLAERIWATHKTEEAARWAVVTLVHASRYEPARQIAAESGIDAAPFSQPGTTRPITDQERDTVFALAVLDGQGPRTGLGRTGLANMRMGHGGPEREGLAREGLARGLLGRSGFGRRAAAQADAGRGQPAMARGRFARVRQLSAAGSGLWVAALRGELQALHQMDAGEEAVALAAEVTAAHPDVTLPDDVLALARTD